MAPALTAADFARAGLDPATETILSVEQTEAIGHDFARWLGVGARGVIAFPFTSLQPVPRPRTATADGRRRLPPAITTGGSRHPAWWLDAHTAWQDPDESDLAYGVRLALELERRGVSVPGDGPVDALAAGLGWALGDPVTDRRVAAYAAGGWDPDLCRFELRPHPCGNELPVSRAERQRQARELLGPRLMLLDILRARGAAHDRATLNAEVAGIDRLEGDLDGLVDDAHRRGEQLHRLAQHGDDRGRLLRARQRLASSVDSLTAALEALDDACRRHQADPTKAVEPGKRRHEAAALIGAVYAAPRTDAPYEALGLRLHSWRRAAAQSAEATRRTLGDLLRSSPDHNPAAGTGTALADARDLLGDVGSVSPFPG